MDCFIAEVAKAQRADGYIHTPVVIDERDVYKRQGYSAEHTQRE